MRALQVFEENHVGLRQSSLHSSASERRTRHLVKANTTLTCTSQTAVADVGGAVDGDVRRANRYDSHRPAAVSEPRYRQVCASDGIVRLLFDWPTRRRDSGDCEAPHVE